LKTHETVKIWTFT